MLPITVAAGAPYWLLRSDARFQGVFAVRLRKAVSVSAALSLGRRAYSYSS